jgi:ferredoxin
MCSACVFDDVCLQAAITTSGDDNTFGFAQEVAIDPAKCNGCGACVLVCPVKVIEVMPKGRYTIAPIDSDSV